MKRVPWYAKGNKAVKNLAGLAVAAVSKRMAFPTDRTDLLNKLQEGRDEEGNLMGREELTAEALTQLIAGSDTTSNSSCAITYYLALNQNAQKKLQKELDEALGPHDEAAVPTYSQLKSLPYLAASINEGLRMHSTSGIGLPRLVPQGGLTILGKTFPPGTVLSVPSYSLHRDTKVWGVDSEEYRPERWFDLNEKGAGEAGGLDVGKDVRGFNAFSYGPRACVGRNLASMELLIIIATIFHRYEFVLEQPDKKFETREGFLRKPVECRVGMRRRDV